jgi:hypothetical protein
MVPDGDVEIETWVDFLERKTEPGAWRWWIGAYFAPLEQIEIAAMTAIQQPYDLPPPPAGSPAVSQAAQLWVEQLSIRWRVIQRSFGALFLRLEGRIAFSDSTPFQVAPSIAWAKHAGRFGFAASFGYAAGFEGEKPNDSYHWLIYRAAASFDIVKGDIAPVFQVGAELYSQEVLAGQNDLTANGRSTVALGPTLSVARGRFWLTLGALAGVTEGGPKVLVRGMLGLAL